MGCKMQYRIDFVLFEYATHQLWVAGIADNQLTVQNSLAKTGGQIVQGDQFLAGFAQLTGCMTADITRTAGNENPFL
jgi:hypothetical protein